MRRKKIGICQEYTYAPNYIKKLSGDAAIQATELYNKLRNEWLIRQKKIQQEKLEKEKIKREPIEKCIKRNRIKKNCHRRTEKKITSKFLEYQILCSFAFDT